jgi:hypothetical protein
MTDETHWQRELIVALRMENAFDAEQMGFSNDRQPEYLKPSPLDSQRAVANIQAWRDYLPEPCVARMIDDGWQWST